MDFVFSQRALFQVLHSFGMYCETCGYCQGMGPIAATLLNYFDAQVSLPVSTFVPGVLKKKNVWEERSIFSPD